MEELIISVVKSHPPIYDKKDHNYKDRSGAVVKIWKVIAVSLGNGSCPDMSMTYIVEHRKINFTED